MELYLKFHHIHIYTPPYNHDNLLVPKVYHLHLYQYRLDNNSPHKDPQNNLTNIGEVSTNWHLNPKRVLEAWS